MNCQKVKAMEGYKANGDETKVHRLVSLNTLLYLAFTANAVILLSLASWFFFAIHEGRSKNHENLIVAQKAADRNEEIILQLFPLALDLTGLERDVNAFINESERMVINFNQPESIPNLISLILSIENRKNRLFNRWPANFALNKKALLERDLNQLVAISEKLITIDSQKGLPSTFQSTQEITRSLSTRIVEIHWDLNNLFDIATAQSIEFSSQTQHNVASLERQLTTLSKSSYLVFFCVFLLFVGFQYWLSQKIKSRLMSLKHYAHAVQNGNYHAAVPFKAKDFTGDLATSIKGMSDTLTGLLEKSQQLAEEALTAAKSKSDFLANVSHEIRTPMNTILGFTEILAGQNLSAKQQEYVSRIRLSSTSLLKLISNILDLSRLETGQLKLNPSPFIPMQILENLIILHSPQAAEKDIEFFLNIPKQLPELLIADSERLTQLLTNLVGNAFKFTDEGFVEITCQPVTFDDSKSAFQFSVKDTGIGIQRNQFEVIFNMFNQADNSETRKYSGIGMGLSISRSIAHLMRGKIDVQSEPNRGSTFTLTLPIELYSSQISQCGMPVDELIPVRDQQLSDLFYDAGSKAQTIEIFLVYAHPDARAALSNQFKLNGISCKDFENLSEALTAFERTKDTKLVIDSLAVEKTGEDIENLRDSLTKFSSIELILPAGTMNPRNWTSRLPVNAVHIKPLRPSDIKAISGSDTSMYSELEIKSSKSLYLADLSSLERKKDEVLQLMADSDTDAFEKFEEFRTDLSGYDQFDAIVVEAEKALQHFEFETARKLLLSIDLSY